MDQVLDFIIKCNTTTDGRLIPHNRKERNVLLNDAVKKYLWLYGIRRMVKEY